MPVNVTVKVCFEAAHRLHNPERSDEWNRQVFGKCNNPHGHGHNYVLEVTVAGEVDPVTGYLIDMKELKEIIRQVIVNQVDHRFLNIEVSWLQGIIPTSENLAMICFHRLAPELPPGITLQAVTIHETERNSATYDIRRQPATQ
jgi:6-pyruvoyltetrahydropterin/6-carboxytetrahydropterin synthase